MTLDAETADRIMRAVDEGFEDQTAFTQDMVRLPSQRGDEGPAQDVFARALRARGLAVDRWAVDVDAIRGHPGFSPVTVDYANAINVVGAWRPEREQGRSLILNGHIDVVPTGPVDMWSTPPYEPKIDGDWMRGRGAADMKAGLVANLFAFDALGRIGARPASTVYLQSVTEEECTGNGALAALLRGYRADAAIIPEPEEEQLVRANVGVIWFKVRVRGHPVHVREAGAGANAIEASFEIIRALRAMEARWNEEVKAVRWFEDLAHPLNLNIGKIAGGDWASSVPAWCEIDCRMAIPPGWKPAERADEIARVVADAARGHPFLANNPPEVEWNGFMAEGYVLEPGTDAETLLAKAHARAFRRELETSVTPGYLDGRVFMLYGDCPCMVYGPLSRAIHGFDEQVSLSSTRRVTKAIALFMAEWCGLQPA